MISTTLGSTLFATRWTLPAGGLDAVLMVAVDWSSAVAPALEAVWSLVEKYVAALPAPPPTRPATSARAAIAGTPRRLARGPGDWSAYGDEGPAGGGPAKE